jgi:hypothetical protein
MRRVLRPAVVPLIAATALLALFVASSALADPPPGPYFNGFETNTAGWFDLSGGTITRRPDFYGTGPTGYANGIDSASGAYHARLGKDMNPDTCQSGGGPRDIHRGPYTNWGGYSSIFPTGGYITRLDIYLDTAWASAHADQRFDWSSAINRPNGMHRRDFVFNVGTEPTGFVISGSNNGDRCSSFPANPGRMPVHIVDPGWYTFEHAFSGVPGGPLTVVMRLIRKSTGMTVGTWIPPGDLLDPDIIGVNVGGNRYGWFIQNEIDQLAIDNSERTGIMSTPGCEVKINDGGHITALNGDDATFGGNAKVSSTGDSSGQQTYQDHGPLTPMNVKALTVDGVICSDDRTTAELAGTASVNGDGEYEYRIKLHDEGEPGTGDTYSMFIPTLGYYSGEQTLDGGNVQIR